MRIRRGRIGRRLGMRLATLAGIAGILGTTALMPARAANDEGARLYHDYCAVCHGDRGDGRSRASGSLVPAPRDFTTPAAATELTLPRMLASVREGRPGTAMTGWQNQLSEAQIESVVGYIREQIMMPVASEDAEVGRRIYADTCSVCHGDDGRGARWTVSNLDPRPRNFTRPETRSELSRGQMIHAATYGKPDTAMPGFQTQLAATEIESVVDYILAAFVPPASAGAAVAGDGAEGLAAVAGGALEGPADFSQPMPGGLVGDPGRGINLYMANCAVCHGVEGDGRGPRAYFILPKPRDFRHPGSRASYDRPRLYKAIARGSWGAEMPAWDTVLLEQEIADVAEYVFRTFIVSEGAGASGEHRVVELGGTQAAE